MKKLLLLVFTLASVACYLGCSSENRNISNQDTVAIDTVVSVEDDTSNTSPTLSPESVYNESPSKYSSAAIIEANDRVEKFILRGHLRLDLNAGKAYINNDLWSLANVEQKTELMATVMIFTENTYGKEEKITRFYNATTGKKIADWGPIGGYDFDY